MPIVRTKKNSETLRAMQKNVSDMLLKHLGKNDFRIVIYSSCAVGIVHQSMIDFREVSDSSVLNYPNNFNHIVKLSDIYDVPSPLYLFPDNTLGFAIEYILPLNIDYWKVKIEETYSSLEIHPYKGLVLVKTLEAEKLTLSDVRNLIPGVASDMIYHETPFYHE